MGTPWGRGTKSFPPFTRVAQLVHLSYSAVWESKLQCVNILSCAIFHFLYWCQNQFQKQWVLTIICPSYQWRRPPPHQVWWPGTWPHWLVRMACWCSGSGPAWNYEPGNKVRLIMDRKKNAHCCEFEYRKSAMRMQLEHMQGFCAISRFRVNEHIQAPSRLGPLLCWIRRSRWRATWTFAEPS